MARRRTALIVLSLFAGAGILAACGTDEIVSGQPENIERGAHLFNSHCAGCHTLDGAAAEGSADPRKTTERTDGPNLSQRKEEVGDVLYAIRNGGFSGAIMPQNIVVGQDAQDIAEFVAKYSGRDAEEQINPGRVPEGF